MEINIEKELQTLKSEYNVFKEGLEKQETLNEKFFKSLRKRPAMAISKEIRDRMLGDVLTVPMIIVICVNIDWPLLFGIFVSLWALVDLGVSLWVSRKLGMLSQILHGVAPCRHNSLDRHAHLHLYAPVCSNGRSCYRTAYYRVGHCFHHCCHCDSSVAI